MSRELLERLEVVRTQMSDRRWWQAVGICNIAGLPAASSVVLEDWHDLVARWPKFSGDNTYPLPGGYGEYMRRTHFTREDPARYMWDRTFSQHACDRWELLEWSIAQLREDLKTETGV